jgi:peroxiredoxin
MAQGWLDVPCISLRLLSSVGKLDFPTERLRVQWQRRQASSSIVPFYNMSVCLDYLLLLFCQANVLGELLLFSASRENEMSEALQIVLSKLKNTEARTIILFHIIDTVVE